MEPIVVFQVVVIAVTLVALVVALVFYRAERRSIDATLRSMLLRAEPDHALASADALMDSASASVSAPAPESDEPPYTEEFPPPSPEVVAIARSFGFNAIASSGLPLPAQEFWTSRELFYKPGPGEALLVRLYLTSMHSPFDKERHEAQESLRKMFPRFWEKESATDDDDSDGGPSCGAASSEERLTDSVPPSPEVAEIAQAFGFRAVADREMHPLAPVMANQEWRMLSYRPCENEARLVGAYLAAHFGATEIERSSGHRNWRELVPGRAEIERCGGYHAWRELVAERDDIEPPPQSARRLI